MTTDSEMEDISTATRQYVDSLVGELGAEMVFIVVMKGHRSLTALRGSDDFTSEQTTLFLHTLDSSIAQLFEDGGTLPENPN